MSLQAKKQEKENSQSLMRRFRKKVKQSGVLRKARKNRFHEPSKSRPMKKKAALRRETLKKEYKRLEKMGLLKK